MVFGGRGTMQEEQMWLRKRKRANRVDPAAIRPTAARGMLAVATRNLLVACH
jgi:hypothetical protein